MEAPLTRRRRRVNPFVQIDRAVVRADTMSYRALGVLTFVLDAPPGRKVDVTTLSAPEGREGREAVAKALRELAAHGHYRVERRQLRNGRFAPSASWSEIPVPHWVRDYQDYEGQPVPLIEQSDGTFMVRRPDKTLVPERYDDDSRWDDADPNSSTPEPDEPADPDVPAGQTANGFPVAGKPRAGSPPAGKPSPKEEEGFGDPEKKDQDLADAQSAPVADGQAASTSKRSRPKAAPKPITVTFPDGTTWTGPVREFPPNYRIPADDDEMLGRVAKMIVDEYVDWWRDANHVPAGELVHDEGRTKVALHKSYVVPALKAGARRWQVEAALRAAAGERRATLLPTLPVWGTHLTAARGGRPVDVGPGGRGRRASQVLPPADPTAPEHQARRAAFG